MFLMKVFPKIFGLWLVVIGVLTGCSFNASIQEILSLTSGTSPISNTVTIAITIPYVTPANMASISVGGTCSSEDAIVEILAPATLGSTTCIGGAWSKNVDVSLLADGPINFVARMTLSTGVSESTTTVTVLKDTIPPSSASMSPFLDGVFSNSLTASTAFTWNAAMDAGSGVDHYEIAIGTSSGAVDTLGWTAIGDVTMIQRTGLSLTEGTIYYPSIRIIDKAGNVSSAISGDGWTVDVTSPGAPTLLSDKFGDSATDKSPLSDWTGSTDSLSGLSHYELAVGTIPGGTDVSSWQNVGSVTKAQATGLSLTAGSMYFLSVRAVDNAGNASAAALGDGWRVFSIDFAGPYCVGGPSGTATVVTDGTLSFLRGRFNQIGKCVSGGTSLSITNESFTLAHASIPQVTGTIAAVISDETDLNSDGVTGWYIGGVFTAVGGVARNNIAHIKEDGIVDSSFNPNANGGVTALLLSGGTLYVGGSFTNIGGSARNSLASLIVSNGLATAWNPNVNASVLSMLLSGTTLYVGGTFTSVNGGTVRNRLASFDTTTGNINAWNPNASDTVYALAVYSTTLYVGGGFTTLNGGTVRNRLASFDMTNGNLTTWNPNIGSTVRALAFGMGSIYVGGDFSTVNGGTARKFLASFDVSTGNLNAWNPLLPSSSNSIGSNIKALAISGSTLFVAGYFISVNGNPRNNLASFELTTGNLTTWSPNVGGTSVDALAIAGGAIYVGGNITTILGKQRLNLAALNAAGDLTSWSPSDTNNTVFSLAIQENTVYIGGSFSNVGGLSRNFLAAIGSDGAATGWNPNSNSTVYALAVKGNTVYVGGEFQFIGGIFRNRLAAISATTGLVTAWDPSPFQPSFPNVNFIYLNGTTVYVGGDFTSIGGEARNKFAAVDESTGLATSFNPDPNGFVNSVAVNSTTIYLGGAFTTIGGQARNRIAAFNATTGAITGWNPNANGSVISLALAGTTSVYAGGSFTSIGGQARNYLANLDATSGLATSWDPNSAANPISMILNGINAYIFQQGLLSPLSN